MTCTSCQAARETNGLWTTYNSPQCLWCTARHIKQLGQLRTPSSEQITARRRVVLAEAVAFGHGEAAIRGLVKNKELALAPLPSRRK